MMAVAVLLLLVGGTSTVGWLPTCSVCLTSRGLMALLVHCGRLALLLRLAIVIPWCAAERADRVLVPVHRLLGSISRAPVVTGVLLGRLRWLSRVLARCRTILTVRRAHLGAHLLAMNDGRRSLLIRWLRLLTMMGVGGLLLLLLRGWSLRRSTAGPLKILLSHLVMDDRPRRIK